VEVDKNIFYLPFYQARVSSQ